MDKLSINSISKNIFRTPSVKNQNQNQNSEQIGTNHTNPFGVSFKGKVLTADVFDSEKASKVSFTGNIASQVSKKSKMLSSAIVGAMNNINGRIDSIVNFGRKITENASNLWKQAQSIEISINPKAILTTTTEMLSKAADSVKLRMSTLGKSNPLLSLPVSDLESRFEVKLATIGGGK